VTYFRDLLIPNQCFFWCKILHYHDPKTNFSEKDTNDFVGRNMPKLPYFEEKKVLSSHIGYSNLAHSSCGSGVHLFQKLKKERKNHASNHLNIATQYVVVEPLYRSKWTEKQEAHSKMTSVVSWLLLFFQNQLSRLFYILYFWITGYQYN
jgi:hypothetical protein